jgi:hypothetical protein
MPAQALVAMTQHRAVHPPIKQRTQDWLTTSHRCNRRQWQSITGCPGAQFARLDSCGRCIFYVVWIARILGVLLALPFLCVGLAVALVHPIVVLVLSVAWIPFGLLGVMIDSCKCRRHRGRQWGDFLHRAVNKVFPLVEIWRSESSVYGFCKTLRRVYVHTLQGLGLSFVALVMIVFQLVWTPIALLFMPFIVGKRCCGSSHQWSCDSYFERVVCIVPYIVGFLLSDDD